MNYYEEIDMYEGDLVEITRLDNGKKEIASVKWSDDDGCVCYYIGGRGYVYRATIKMNPIVIGKQIPNFPNYAISKDGKVWSKRRSKWLKLAKGKYGHLWVYLGRGNRGDVHRLVLETYIGKCPKGMECRHLDGNPQNNNLSNLKWDTHYNNMQDRIKHGTDKYNKGETNPRAKLTEQDVRMIIYTYQIKLFRICELAKMYNIKWKAIYCIVTKRNWKYLWQK